MKKLILDGNDFTNDAVFDQKIKYSRTKDNAEGSVFIDKISFTGDAFDYLNQIFFVNRDRKKVVDMQISPKNCNKTYYFKIGFRDVKKCFCEIECSPNSDQQTKYDYFRKTLWYGNGFDTSYEHFRVYFVSGFTLVSIILTLIYPIIAAILLLLNAIDDILDIGDIPTLDDLNEVVSGAGNYHIGYSIKEIFEYHAKIAGLSFKSSILQTDPYDKTVFIMGQSNNGFDDDQNVKFDKQNAYGWSVLKLAQAFKLLHNAEFWIEGDILRYETKLVYETVDNVFVDLDALDIQLCEFYDVTKGYAYADIRYATDTLDQDGNQASDLYNDIVEYNSPPEEWQKGSLDHSIQDFSPIRYQQDKYDENFWSKLVNQLRISLKGRRYDMLLSNSRCSQMKVFVWDGVSQRSDCRTQRRNPNGTGYEYNWDYFINQNPDKSYLVLPNLYDKFFYYEDPRIYYYYGREDIKYSPCDFCDDIDHLDIYGIRSGIKKEGEGNGIADEITVNFDAMEIEISKPIWRIKA